ncbi:MAG: TonB-dependent receptor [Bacteroidales bacterium]|nr:TonB-dependent receptor [Bacteroidales bacterium]
MKKLLVFSILFLSFNFTLFSQEEQRVTISGSFENISFAEFAERLDRDFGIDLFYRDDWIEDIRVNVSGDSINLVDILNKVLDEKSIHFVQRGRTQFFLTGQIEFNNDIVIQDNNLLLTDDSKVKSIAEQYFRNISYEKIISRVTIGNALIGSSSLVSVLGGRISSASSGEPVIGATLFVEGTSNGVITDGNGSYSLSVETGLNFTMKISCLGMIPETYRVDMQSSGILNIEMSEKLIDIQEVVVRSGKHDNVQGMQMGFQRIEMNEIKSIPVVLGERDILKIASMMPGVQTVGEGAAGFNVRGSASDQNLFLINEVPVLNTGHLFGFFSAFNPDMISDFNLYKSNFPVEYGGRLASVFEVSTRKGNKKKFGARGAISPVTGSLLVETPIVKDKSSIIVGARSTYSDWILKRINNPDINNSDASFYDLMGNIHILNDDFSSLQVFAYYSKDKFTLAQRNDYRYNNLGASLKYDKNIKDKWKLKIAAVLSNYSNYHTSREQATKAFEHQFDVRSQEIKVNFTGNPWLKHRVGVGANAILHNLNQGSYDPYGQESLFVPNDFGKERGLEYALFVFDEITLARRLKLYTGLRYSLFNYLGPNEVYNYTQNKPLEPENIIDTTSYANNKSISHYSGPEFRLSLHYEFTNDFSLKFSFNRMRQYLFMLSNTVSIAPTDRWKLADPYLAPPVSDQLSFGLYKNINKYALETSAEFYYKKGDNIVEYKDGADLSSSPIFEAQVLQGQQESYGAEFMVKRNAGRFTGWLSYTWSKSTITVNGKESWQKINNGISFPANYDKPHAINFVGSIKISRRVSIASNLVYNSGRPITYPTGIIYVDDIQAMNYSLRNEYRIPDYFRVDVSLNFEGNLIKDKFAHGSWAFSVYNLTGRKNAYSIYFKNENGNIRGYKQSIYGVPIFTVSYNFKLGNYAVE